MLGISKEVVVKVPVERLAVGLYVDLELPWNKHPFLFSRFKIRAAADVAAIRELGISEVSVIPARSDVEIPSQAPATPIADNSASLHEAWQEKAQRLKRAQQYRAQRNQIAQKYHERAQLVRSVAADLKARPANAIHHADRIVEGFAADFENSSEFLTNLINLGSGDHGFPNHSVNVTVLSLILAAAEGVRGEELRHVGMGALLHDVGKVEVPSRILINKGPLNKAERSMLRQHPLFGRRLTERSRGTAPQVLEIIERHHELLDGLGYPARLGEDQLSTATRVVTICNIYDNLCNPRNPARAMTPKNALALMYTKYQTKLDKRLVERFIRTMGIYPPGTVVQLNDGKIGMVVAADSRDLLKPELLIYSTDIPKEQALILKLREHDELAIEEVLKPGEYPSRINEYLGAEGRIGYFVEGVG
ncbi:HD-GYP domain-containing protein [Endothiovibrio diazotrophicus]